MINLESARFDEEILCSMGEIVEKQEQEYGNMMETIYFTSNPELCDSILEGMATPLEDCISTDKVEYLWEEQKI